MNERMFGFVDHCAKQTSALMQVVQKDNLIFGKGELIVNPSVHLWMELFIISL
jgi:hypothetical protein